MRAPFVRLSIQTRIVHDCFLIVERRWDCARPEKGLNMFSLCLIEHTPLSPSSLIHRWQISPIEIVIDDESDTYPRLMMRTSGSLSLTRVTSENVRQTWMAGFIQSFKNQRRNVEEDLLHLDDHQDLFAGIVRECPSDEDQWKRGSLDSEPIEQCETFCRNYHECVQTVDSQRSFHREGHLTKKEKPLEKNEGRTNLGPKYPMFDLDERNARFEFDTLQVACIPVYLQRCTGMSNARRKG